MSIYKYGLIISLFLFSCSNQPKENNTISLDKMKVVVLQLMKADEHFSRVSSADSNWRKEKKNLQFYQQIFDFNKVDRVQFYNQIEYLEKHPVEFKTLMDSVNELSKREKLPIKS